MAIKINSEKIFKYTLVSGVAFFTGMLTTFYKLDQRLWDENINKAIDIETRFYNYPGGEDDCYTLTDLELIVFGKVQKGY
jgi:hypothetical protein